MDEKKQSLLKQKDYLETKIEEVCDFINSTPVTDPGYDKLTETYLKLTEMYDDVLDELKKLDSEDEIKKEKRIEVIFRSAELAIRIAVPIVSVLAGMSLAKLSYCQDANMVLKNGNVMVNARDVVNLAKLKV